MKAAFDQMLRRDAAQALLKEWGMEYSLDTDGIIALESDFHKDGVRGSTSKSVRALAEKMFGSKDAAIVLYMGEFAEKHQVTRLVGAPPGFVGSDDDSGTLVDKLRRNPSCLLVLDEIDKAHPEVLKILTESIREKKILDSRGREVSFENVIVLTTQGPPPAQVRAERQVKMGIELAIRATEGIQNPMQVFKPLRFKGAGFTMFRA